MTEFGGDASGSAETAEVSAPESDAQASGEGAAESGTGSAGETPASEPGEAGPAEPTAADQSPGSVEMATGNEADAPAEGQTDAPAESASANEAAESASEDHGPARSADGASPDRAASDAPEATGDFGAEADSREPGEGGPAQASESAAEHEPGQPAEPGSEPGERGDQPQPGERSPDAATDEASTPDGDQRQEDSPVTELGGEQDAEARAVEPGEIGPAEAAQDDKQATDAPAEPAETQPAETQPTETEPAEGDLRAGTNTSERAGERTDVADAHPDLYQRTDAPPPQVDGPHEAPESWAGEINPGKGLDNCGDCARAVQQTWAGDPKCAAVGGPEGNEVMTEWAGASPESASADDINARLTELGPGSSAIVGFDRDEGDGHWFNAVNDNGTIKAVDGQSGKVETWPPTESGMYFSPAEMRKTEAIFFDANGRVVR